MSSRGRSYSASSWGPGSVPLPSPTHRPGSRDPLPENPQTDCGFSSGVSHNWCPGWVSNSGIQGLGWCRWVPHTRLTRANVILPGRQVSCCTGLLRSFCDHGVTTSTSDDVWNPAELDVRPIPSRGHQVVRGMFNREATGFGRDVKVPRSFLEMAGRVTSVCCHLMAAGCFIAGPGVPPHGGPLRR